MSEKGLDSKFKLEKTSPEKMQKIGRVLGLIYGAFTLSIAGNVWMQGNYDDARSRTIFGVIVIVVVLIITSPKINILKKYSEFMQKKVKKFKKKEIENKVEL